MIPFRGARRSGGDGAGRYLVHAQLGSGGMGTVHLGRLIGPAGFGRTVAIKRLHPHLADDPDFVSSFVDEARVAACIRHPNVVSTLDVRVDGDAIMLVMDYVEGDTLHRLLKHGPPPRLNVVSAVACQMLTGLHAAHEAKNPRGELLKLVHRDVSPQNILVGTDGSARLLDFGVAKANWRSQTTKDGALKGKVPYMAPEQLEWRPLDRRADIFAASVVIWEALTNRRLFGGPDTEDTIRKIRSGEVLPPSRFVSSLPPALDTIVMRGLAVEADDRFATALEMASAIEAVIPPATTREVGAWVKEGARELLAQREAQVAELERAALVEEGGADPDTQNLVTSPSAFSEGTTESMDIAGLVSEPGARPRRRAVGAALLASLGIVALCLALFGARWAPGKASAAAPVPSSVPEVVPPTKPPASPSPVEAASVIPDPLPQARTANVRVLPQRAPSKAPSSTTRTKANCDPPFTLDPQGIRHFRPECI